jgi:hypothetical protein
MSNVLIGIIGVILFIGLALAGALILGDDFRTATYSTKASAEVQRLTQISQAIQMYNLKTGTRFQSAANLQTLTPRFMASGANTGVRYGLGGIDTRNTAGFHAGDAGYVVEGGSTEEALKVCAAIAESSGMELTSDGKAPLGTSPTGESGCFRINGGWGDLFNSGNFAVAYHSI